MRLTNPKATIVDRTLKFLQDARTQLRHDPMPRMLYTAMTHHLGWDTMNAAVRLGILKRVGWRWYWEAKRPTRSMAEQVHHERREHHMRTIAFSSTRRQMRRAR